MHLYAISRGIKGNVDNAINDLQAQFFKYPKAKDEKGNNCVVQFAVRPVQLWEFVFPKEVLPEVVKTLKGEGYADDYVQDKKGMKKYFSIIRKILKCKPVPKMNLKKVKERIIRKKWVSFHLIGIKEDKIGKDGVELL